jgi:hypothetical protein
MTVEGGIENWKFLMIFKITWIAMTTIQDKDYRNGALVISRWIVKRLAKK